MGNFLVKLVLATMPFSFAGHEWGNGSFDQPLDCDAAFGLFFGTESVSSSATLEKDGHYLDLTLVDSSGEKYPPLRFMYELAFISNGLTVTRLYRLPEECFMPKCYRFHNMTIEAIRWGEDIKINLTFDSDVMKTKSPFICKVRQP
ncbi:hypothetical protein [Bdellovibrio sp. NC01]|uniref:hypothetical protein n=1 Tax=Bdellovibrio sp. NC01 TaxID=2220073 RepID=UPI0011599F1A|nr:hypothetical protein [Bdellovibrio sp. NC01]QDK38337.1 hypothetical protein DOE51_12480 [Bdellovibrio sp. NC01]